MSLLGASSPTLETCASPIGASKEASCRRRAETGRLITNAVSSSWSRSELMQGASVSCQICDFKPVTSRVRRSVVSVLETNQNFSSGASTAAFGSLSVPASPSTLPSTAEERIFEMVVKHAAQTAQAKPSQSLLDDIRIESDKVLTEKVLEQAYQRCGVICAEYAKTFYLGTKLMTPERQRAIWAIYVWCRRTDELVDGPNASHITPRALDRWEERLTGLFEGKPYDMLDAALSDTVARFPQDPQPYRDMIDGMRMDLHRSRYNNFDELYVYCYNVAGTVGLMSVPVMGIDPASKCPPEKVYEAALALGIANQLTNILRDVGEDSRRGRVYVPQDELSQFGLSDSDIFEGKVTDNWRAFMKFQIARARDYFAKAEAGVFELSEYSRWPVWASLSLYSQILDYIEVNDYDNFSKRAYVPKWKKLISLPSSYITALRGPNSS